MLSMGPYFEFGLIAGRVFWCTRKNEAFKIIGKDKAAAITATDERGPYWEFGCPACGGHHRFYPEEGIHLPPESGESE